MHKMTYSREQFKTSDIMAKEDVNRNRHAHNIKQTKKHMRYEWQDRFEHNFNVRVDKFLKEKRQSIKDNQNDTIAERQQESMNARYMKRLNVM
ncbi:MAG: hypothetical protein K2Q18_03980 [Bdellovibrionales bacterium]|nr:hypothetical protein [Bdellovibrionales bacterium]